MAARLAHAVVASCIWLVVRASAAQDAAAGRPGRDAPAVVLVHDACAVVPRDELRTLIALELAPRTVTTADDGLADTASLHARVTCTSAEARLWVADSARSRRQELTVDLAAIPPAARARLVALTLSELVATLELEEAPRTGPQTSRRRPASAAAAQSSGVGVGVRRAWLSAGLVREGRPAMLMPAIQSGLTAASARWPVALLTALQVQRGARSVGAGDVVAWNASGTAGVAGQLTRPSVALSLGVGLRLGYARLRGDVRDDAPGSGRTVSGVWWGPVALLSAVLPTRGRWGARCGLELSHVAREVRGLDGAGRASYSLAGLQLHASVGVSLALSGTRSSRE